MQLLANTTFYFLLYNCFHRYTQEYTFEKGSWLIIRGCVWLCLLSVIGSILLFLFIQIGGNPLVNDTIGMRMDLFFDNIERFGHQYFFPYVSILMKSHEIRIPFFQSEGIICGLYHEPHIVTFMTFPALFILLGRLKSIVWKLIVWFSYLLIMLLAASTTNIGAFFACLFVMMLFVKDMKKLVIPFIIVGGMFFLFWGLNFSDFLFVQDKMDSGSKDYSVNTILFAFTPRTLLGSNFLSNDYLFETSSVLRDVGYIPFALNVIFLSIFSYKLFCVIVLSKSAWVKMVGISILYFFLHSMKIAMIAYSLSYLMFMSFLLTVFHRDVKLPNTYRHDR